MKFKLDECVDVRLAALFSDAGHEVHTVQQEGLSGSSDDTLYSVCLREELILLTQDTGFSNPFRFPPHVSRGIIVLRNPSQLFSESRDLVKILLGQIREHNPQGRLWVVDRRGIRIWPSD